MNVFPLFPTLLAIIEVKEDVSKLKEISSEFKFPSNSQDPSAQRHLRSESLAILDHFPEESKILLKHFNKFKNEILRLETTDFAITTSWATKTLPLSNSEFHNHKNCLYSAVFYYDDVPGGEIEFQSTQGFSSNISVNDPTEWNMYNSYSFRFRPEKNNLIIFPSTLIHRISTNYSKEVRYSLAFNLFPIGQFGIHDSSVNLTSNKIIN